MKILVACEFSGTVRDAFIEKGHDAVSCDLLPTDKPGPHYQGDVFDIINEGWDMMIAFPPCTYLTVTGNKWFYHPEDKHLPIEERRPHPKFPNRRADREDAVGFFMALASADIDKIAIENPIGIMSSRWRKPDQIIQPWQFGHEASKATCLWLKGLPLLTPTDIVGRGEFMEYKSGKRCSKWYADAAKHPPAMRAKIRSKTFDGIAEAMSEQWSCLP